MLFSSTVFLYCFLPAVLFCYYIVFRKSRLLQNVFLLISSLLFYAWGEPKFVFVMMVSIFVNWAAGLAVSRERDRKTAAKLIITLDVLFNLGLLFVFKYLAFTCRILNRLSGAGIPVPEIALPIGISFFTFQAMSYVLDVYHQKGEVQTNLLYVGLYISFFPQLIAGPIVRYETVAMEIRTRHETLDDFFDGFARFTVGLSKKVLLANSFAFLADQPFDAVHAGQTVSAAFAWLGAVGYALQIYFDFSGYSDMAIGLGKMFGFHFLENFNYPYISSSVTEFWRRWHMSLGTWFRDYLYIPLGGSRCGKIRNILNLFTVWFLTGLWHGADLTFIVWGMMYFVLLVFEKTTGIYREAGRKQKPFLWFYTMFFVVLGWVLFRAESLRDAYIYLQSMFGLNGNAVTDGMFTGWFTQNRILLAAGMILSTPVLKVLLQKLESSSFLCFLRAFSLLFLFILSVASLVSSTYNPFIYFNF